MTKVLLVIGDGAEVIDTMVPLYRLAEDFEVVKAGPAKRTYHLVQHHHEPDWDITVETPGYTLDSDIAFRDVNPDGIHRPRAARRAGAGISPLRSGPDANHKAFL